MPAFAISTSSVPIRSNAAYCFPVRDVETDRLDARDALGRGGDLLLAEREGRDVRAFLQEAAARRLADPARASGDDDTLVAETFHAATIYS